MPHALRYLPGLHTIRFFAAAFVIVQHGHAALVDLRVLVDSGAVAVHRGIDAVELFFTLSGFLITYLLIKEMQKTGTVNVQRFYIRRILRIWPLYFVCLAGGLFVLGIAVP